MIEDVCMVNRIVCIVIDCKVYSISTGEEVKGAKYWIDRNDAIKAITTTVPVNNEHEQLINTLNNEIKSINIYTKQELLYIKECEIKRNSGWIDFITLSNYLNLGSFSKPVIDFYDNGLLDIKTGTKIYPPWDWNKFFQKDLNHFLKNIMSEDLFILLNKLSEYDQFYQHLKGRPLAENF